MRWLKNRTRRKWLKCFAVSHSAFSLKFKIALREMFLTLKIAFKYSKILLKLVLKITSCNFYFPLKLKFDFGWKGKINAPLRVCFVYRTLHFGPKFDLHFKVEPKWTNPSDKLRPFCKDFHSTGFVYCSLYRIVNFYLQK